MRTVCLPLANVVGNVIAHVPVAPEVQCREPALTTAPLRGAPASRTVKTTFCLWCSLQDFFEAFGVSPGMAWVCQTPPVPLLMTTSARVRLPSTARDVVAAPLGLPRSWTTPITSPDGSVRTACSACALSTQATQRRPDGAAETAIDVASLLRGTYATAFVPTFQTRTPAQAEGGRPGHEGTK